MVDLAEFTLAARRAKTAPGGPLGDALDQWVKGDRNAARAALDVASIDPALKARAHARLALSAMTLPHALARVLLCEQVFRAWSLLHGHPYHRA